MICVAVLLFSIVQGSADFRRPASSFPFNPSTVIRGVENFVNFIDKSLLEQRNFTLSEVANYNGQDGRSLHIVLDGDVYDVTEFVGYHPGGDHHLKNNAGKDVTSVMRAAGMPDYVFTDVLKRFKVGKIKNEE